jgi:hypothetical protein
MSAKSPEVLAILIIIGMHRSGTSLTAALLQSAGLHIGQNLLAGGPGNVKGHFENLDFHSFHRAVLQSQGVNEDGWTLQEKIDVEELYVDEAHKLVAQNAASPAWGWKDPRTVLFLEFWAELLPQANFVIIYRSPWEVVDSLYRRGSDPIILNYPDLAAKFWLHYNRKILSFYNRFSDRCLLTHIQTVIQHKEVWIEAINQKFYVQLTTPVSDLYDASVMHHRELDSHRASLINYYFPDAIELYGELVKRAWYPDNLVPNQSWRKKIPVAPFRSWVFQDWLSLCNQEREFKSIQSELEHYKMQLNIAQSNLESLQFHNHQMQEEITRYKEGSLGTEV